jgi:hypothetical protein
MSGHLLPTYQTCMGPAGVAFLCLVNVRQASGGGGE